MEPLCLLEKLKYGKLTGEKIELHNEFSATKSTLL